jgi:soluble lytic murein transglycosylase-like protein
MSWKSQLYQESRLDPAAVSPVGAAGLAQFMPGTWADVARALRIPPGVSPHHAFAVEAGAWYMARLRRQWSSPRPEEDRHRLAQAAYNAGLGHILAAQRRCGGPNLYSDIIRCLPAITGRHSEETITYVQRIAKWRAMMEAGL